MAATDMKIMNLRGLSKSHHREGSHTIWPEANRADRVSVPLWNQLPSPGRDCRTPHGAAGLDAGTRHWRRGPDVGDISGDGFPGSSAAKESTCNAGDPSSILGLER